ncbi:hypothetical protein [Haloferula sp. BvORR071]|uniref:hypothetical protein n=1 Tax=Haloferula sp. BvORR071 TaxID=1396141 RepID=UPI0005553EEB|nr:hypothetical protein [Haloferula sp. BvORR071]
MPGLSPKPYRRFNRVILGFAAGVLLVFTAFNTWINPLWVSKSPWTDDKFAEYRPIYRQQRTGKAGIARSMPWQVGFFGSSRVDIAYDPMLPQWQGKKAVNLAVSAGTLPETAGIVRYTLDHCPLETAIVGIDLGDISGSGSGIKSTGYMESPFNPKGDAVERELRYVAGVSTFETAVKTLGYWNRRNKPGFVLPEYTPQGHRLRHQDKPNVAAGIRRDAIPHAMKGVRRRDKIAADNNGRIPADPEKTRLTKQILEDCKKHGVALKIAIPPNLGIYISVYQYFGDPDPVFSTDRETLVKLVDDSNKAHPDAPPAEIWDFNDYHEMNCEPLPTTNEARMHWFLDGTHARKALGDVMQARIMGWPIEGPGADYGVKLTADNLAQRLDSIRAGYQNYQKVHPDEFKWMVDAIKSYQTSGKEDAPEQEGGQEF